MTLVETVVAFSIMSIMFLAMGFLVIFSAKNSYNIHQQSLAQSSAASAVERIANTLRNAQQFGFYGSDDSATSPLLRLTYGIPNPSNGVVTTGIVAFKAPSKPGGSDGLIKIFDNVSRYSPDAKGDWEYRGVSAFSIIRQSPYWANFRVRYYYPPYSFSKEDKNKDDIADSLLAGEFVTDVIAKNHTTGGSANADYTSSTLTSL